MGRKGLMIKRMMEKLRWVNIILENHSVAVDHFPHILRRVKGEVTVLSVVWSTQESFVSRKVSGFNRY